MFRLIPKPRLEAWVNGGFVFANEVFFAAGASHRRRGYPRPGLIPCFSGRVPDNTQMRPFCLALLLAACLSAPPPRTVTNAMIHEITKSAFLIDIAGRTVEGFEISKAATGGATASVVRRASDARGL